MVAGRYLRARRGERFVSVIAIFSLVGIALGVATLIIVMSVMGGFRQELLGRILGVNGHLTVYAAREAFTDFDAVTARVRAIPGVVQATALAEGSVGISTERGGLLPGLVRGVRAEDLKRRKAVAENIRLGTLDDLAGDDAIAIGIRLSQRLGITVGDRLTLVSPQGQPTAFGTVPRIRAYRVVAVFEVGMNEYDSTFLFMPMEAAQAYFRLPDAATQIEVFVADPDRVWEVTRRIRTELSGMPVRILDWQNSNNAFFAAVQVERNVMFLILTLIILVAAFNIVSSLIMMVKDKARDIAILRTMGATRGAVLRIFLMCGASVGVLGTLIGVMLGIVFCWNIESIRQLLQSLTGTTVFDPEIYFLSQIPAVLDWNEVSQVVAMALGLSLLATIYPSWRAARTDPVEALRNE
jgi:lipoprotein-releasing system permease protein